MKRTKPLRRKTWMRSRSKKMAARYAGKRGRRALVARLLRERPRCEAREVFANFVIVNRTNATIADGELGAAIAAYCMCAVRSKDVHEVLARSAGGDILDESNVICVCRACHDWIAKHPQKALELGLRKSRYGRGAA